MPEHERVDHYRMRARQLRQTANAEEHGPETRQAMLELAHNYERLADLLDQLTE
jgi:hypothetical protein